MRCGMLLLLEMIPRTCKEKSNCAFCYKHTQLFDLSTLTSRPLQLFQSACTSEHTERATMKPARHLEPTGRERGRRCFLTNTV